MDTIQYLRAILLYVFYVLYAFEICKAKEFPGIVAAGGRGGNGYTGYMQFCCMCIKAIAFEICKVKGFLRIYVAGGGVRTDMYRLHRYICKYNSKN